MDKKIDFKKKRKFTLLIGMFCVVGALCFVPIRSCLKNGRGEMES